jgi:hypothetical protein
MELTSLDVDNVDGVFNLDASLDEVIASGMNSRSTFLVVSEGLARPIVSETLCTWSPPTVLHHPRAPLLRASVWMQGIVVSLSLGFPCDDGDDTGNLLRREQPHTSAGAFGAEDLETPLRCEALELFVNRAFGRRRAALPTPNAIFFRADLNLIVASGWPTRMVWRAM